MIGPRAYYNENDPKAAEWLRNLIRENLIAPGDVDTRSIIDVIPADLVSYTQCHFFAGIGGWSLALRMAGWPDSRPVWTGSCPCQPFSQAGKGKGFADERHLWPAWCHLIEHSDIATIFGEQVASPDGLVWLSRVQTDLEARGLAFGAADLSAAGVGAPHIRQRLYWVADTHDARPQGWPRPEWEQRGGEHGQQPQDSGTGPVADAPSDRWEQRWSESNGRRALSAWDDADWIPCRDGKARPVEPGSFPLAHGIPGRVGLLRGYGNAIVPPLAAEFIIAYLESAVDRGWYKDLL